jgi:hypothetical protein
MDPNAAGDENAGEVSRPVSVNGVVSTEDADGAVVALGQR